jgi:hypothetical protein
MNDVGERIPNWFESAHLYYAYTGDTTVMHIGKKLSEYAIDHGTTPATFAWPNFPYTTTNAGDMEFKGFDAAKRFVLHEVQVDHAGDMGLTYYRLYLYTGKEKFKTAAISIANTLADKAKTGNAEESVWPYRVVMNTGEVTAPYGANWIGAYSLLEHLVKANAGNAAAYQNTMNKVRYFMLRYPMQTGCWADGHTDTDVKSNTYKSNMGKSNTALYILDNPTFDPEWKTRIPQMIQWTETYFVTRCVEGVPAKGNSSLAINYHWFDANPIAGINFYRLKIIEAGQQSYSGVIKVILPGGIVNKITIYPNPLKDNIIYIQLILPKGNYKISLTNKLGQRILNEEIEHEGGFTNKKINLIKSLVSGVYQVSIIGAGINITEQVIKN